MNTQELIESFSEFKDLKNIDRVTMMNILEDVFRSVLVKLFGDTGNFDIIINPDKGDLEVWHNRVIVPDGEVEDPISEISLTDAQKIEPDFEVGEDVSEEFRIDSDIFSSMRLSRLTSESKSIYIFPIPGTCFLRASSLSS